MVYASSFDQDAFFAYVADNDIGTGIHAPYSEDPGMNQVWDLRLRLELPSVGLLDRWVGENHVSFVLDVENVLNLLNDNWGTYEAGPRFSQAAIVRADLVDANDIALLGVDGAPALTGDAPRTTCQRQSDCLYRFNRFRSVASAHLSASRSVYRIRLGVRIDM